MENWGKPAGLKTSLKKRLSNHLKGNKQNEKYFYL